MQLSQQHTTAILVFAHSAQEELRHKPIAKGDILFDELTRHTLQTVEKIGLPYFLYTEKEQNGATFAERFTNAIQDVFDRGYQNLITVGNDTPHLKVSHIREAQMQLEAKKFVLGPSEDGGFYLMGLSRSLYNPTLFKGLPWQTSGLYREITHLFNLSQVEIHRLGTLMDIDSWSDIGRLVLQQRKLSRVLWRLLLHLFFSIKRELGHIPEFYISFFNTSPHNKGSPVLLPY